MKLQAAGSSLASPELAIFVAIWEVSQRKEGLLLFFYLSKKKYFIFAEILHLPSFYVYCLPFPLDLVFFF